ncbi:flagellar biosynthesis protein FliQ [Acetobacterium paludosum]|uniref:Flagellar biosynthetic protein FliQ n=2 Tax=Acetobacterium TaxID=33951 RepID=A0A923I260_9FIRM|nr:MULTISPECIES: flagellar biosynthesis protein FliQ [Acetobacterium]MBC3797081.1 flagellar biosynthesis protein FliQ [Acetobacterium tundrae]MBC3888643.1 flagellar biosynthesis protein FliQ [Acetobacterium paludosum]
MDTSALIEVFRDAVITGLKVAAPILLLTMAVGLIIAIFQAATSINEQTMTFVPKLAIVAIALVLCGGWMLQQMMDFTMRIFELIATQI